MKLIDEKGRLFGKINLIDLLVVLLIVAVLAAIVIYPMLPLEYRDRVVAILTHPLYYLGLGHW